MYANMYETGYSMLYKTRDDRANRRLAIVTIGITSTVLSTGIHRVPVPKEASMEYSVDLLFLDNTSTQYCTCSVQYILRVPPLDYGEIYL